MQWIKLTTGEQEEPIWVNMATVCRVERGFDGAALVFIEPNWDDLYVNEKPEAIMGKLKGNPAPTPPTGSFAKETAK